MKQIVSLLRISSWSFVGFILLKAFGVVGWAPAIVFGIIALVLFFYIVGRLMQDEKFKREWETIGNSNATPEQKSDAKSNLILKAIGGW